MKIIRSMLISTVMSVLVGGCNVVEGISEMNTKMEKVNSELTELLKSEAQIGWNTHNGKLVQVTIVVDATAMKDKTIGELKELVVPVVRKHFEQEPNNWYISANYPGDNG